MVIRGDELLTDGEMVEDDGRDRDPRRHLRRRAREVHRAVARSKAEVQLRAHNAGFCRPCYLGYFQPPRRARDRRTSSMFTRDERVLVAVSGGKDSLALWDVLVELGYRTTGLYLGLGIGAYSDALAREGRGLRRARASCRSRVVALADERPGLARARRGRSRRAACRARPAAR